MIRPWIVYLSGPISGNPTFKEDFLRAERVLLTAAPAGGIYLLNPVRRHPAGLSSAEFMRLSFSEIDICADVCLLPGWEESEGAQLELAYANYIGKPVFQLTDRFPELMEKEGYPDD